MSDILNGAPSLTRVISVTIDTTLRATIPATLMATATTAVMVAVVRYRTIGGLGRMATIVTAERWPAWRVKQRYGPVEGSWGRVRLLTVDAAAANQRYSRIEG